ncbi:hypothetical protein CIJ96_20845, partial [Escherichia coli]
MLWGFVFVSFISKELALGQSEYISWVKCTSWLSNFVNLREGANKRGNSSRLTQSFHFFMFEPIFSP